MMGNFKVLSLFKTKTYSEYFPNISVLGNKVDFFLECDSYNLTIPVKVKCESKLDIFEEAVLNLIAYNATSTTNMADILCLTPDLINFIIIRLQELQFLQSDGKNLSEKGKEYICVKEKNSNNENIECLQAKVFVLNQTGEILPYILTGEFISEPIENVDKSFMMLEYGTVGSPIRIRGKIIYQNRGDKKNNILQSSLIRKAIDKYNKLVTRNVNYDPIVYAKEWAIENTQSETIYIHMQAVVQNGNIDEILISDGFVVNIDFINDYLKTHYPDFISIVKERATKNIILNEEEEGENHKIKFNYKYRELEKLLSRIKEHSHLYKFIEDDSAYHSSSNNDENQKLQAGQKQFLLNCYSAFEWSLYYYDKKYPLDNKINSIIESQTVYQNANTLLYILEKIGIVKPQRFESLFYSLDSNRIKRMFRTNTPELRVALSLAILTSAYNSHCGFRNLLNKRPGMFRILCNLFNSHGDLSHQTFTCELDMKRNMELYDLLIDFIAILQPDFDLNECNSLKMKKDIIQTSQDKLNAEVSLSRRLGPMYYYDLLPESIKEEWILVSPDKIQYPETAEYFDILYRIMQDTLYVSLKDIRKNPQLCKDEILLKLKENGIVSNSFNTIKEKFIRDILMNQNATLGANAIVYLYYQKDNMLERLKQANFVQIIEELVGLRKHGNNVALNINLNSLNKIRDDMLDLVKMIGVN